MTSAARPGCNGAPILCKDNVRKQCATARKYNEHDMNAQDCTLASITPVQFSPRTKFSRNTGNSEPLRWLASLNRLVAAFYIQQPQIGASAPEATRPDEVPVGR